jgi:hypothetical protein
MEIKHVTENRKDHEERMMREARYRGELVTPEGGPEWLAELLMSAGREFGGTDDAFPRLLAVLCANIDNHTSCELKALFFLTRRSW